MSPLEYILMNVVNSREFLNHGRICHTPHRGYLLFINIGLFSLGQRSSENAGNVVKWDRLYKRRCMLYFPLVRFSFILNSRVLVHIDKILLSLVSPSWTDESLQAFPHVVRCSSPVKIFIAHLLDSVHYVHVCFVQGSMAFQMHLAWAKQRGRFTSLSLPAIPPNAAQGGIGFLCHKRTLLIHCPLGPPFQLLFSWSASPVQCKVVESFKHKYLKAAVMCLI